MKSRVRRLIEFATTNPSVASSPSLCFHYCDSCSLDVLRTDILCMMPAMDVICLGSAGATVLKMLHDEALQMPLGILRSAF